MLTPIAIAAIMIAATVWDYHFQRLAPSRRERDWRRVRLAAVLIGGFSALWLVLHALGYGPQGRLVSTRQSFPFSSVLVEETLLSTRVAWVGFLLGLQTGIVASFPLDIYPRLHRYYAAKAAALLEADGALPRTIAPRPLAAPPTERPG
ncbi:MAG: hypothetical protein ACREMO_07180 [Gemmatimonadales bacterium]